MAERMITWVLVANGARARIFVRDGGRAGLAELPECSFAGSRQRSRELRADRPGRTFDSTGRGRHAKEPRIDPQREMKDEFLRDVVDWLVEQDRDGRFDRLVIAAPPQALGALRRFLPDHLAGKIAGEVTRDLTRLTAAGVARRLGDLAAA